MLAVMGEVAVVVYDRLGLRCCAPHGSTPTGRGPRRSSSPAAITLVS